MALHYNWAGGLATAVICCKRAVAVQWKGEDASSRVEERGKGVVRKAGRREHDVEGPGKAVGKVQESKQGAAQESPPGDGPQAEEGAERQEEEEEIGDAGAIF